MEHVSVSSREMTHGALDSGPRMPGGPGVAQYSGTWPDPWVRAADARLLHGAAEALRTAGGGGRGAAGDDRDARQVRPEVGPAAAAGPGRLRGWVVRRAG